jgi:CBS domain containing-hemolysin-like protein
MHGDELRELVGFALPEGDYETLAGFLLTCLGRMAEEGDRVEHEGWRLEVLAMDRHRIESVRITAPPGEDAPGW